MTNSSTPPNGKQVDETGVSLATRLLIAGIVVAVVVGFVYRRRQNLLQPEKGATATNVATSATGNKPEILRPERTQSEFLNTNPHVKYVGSTACKECHSEQHRTFTLTQHSHSLTQVDANTHPPNGVVDHLLSKRRFEISRDPDSATVVHREFVLSDDDEQSELAAWPIQYQIGSGHVALSYFVEEDGFLLQSPVTWFAKDEQWKMSPGYDTADHMSFGRVISSGCLYCHTGHLADPDEHGLRHRIHELSIGCERCHGPGELHVKRHRSDSPLTDDIDRTIVNPTHLSRELSEDVCSQCHLNGDIQSTVRGGRPHDFRPGLPLKEYRLEFRMESEAKIRVAGHVEQLHKSACYQNTATLTCVSCHQPHEDLQPVERLAQHRQVCINCHQQQTCRMPIADRDSKNDNNCIDCHMPRSPTEVTHVALTHHRIGIHSGPEPASLTSTKDTTNSKSSAARLIPLQPLKHLSEVDRNRSLGLAHLALVRMNGKSTEQMPDLEHAAGLLRQAYESGIRDPETLIALAAIARDFGQDARGIALAEQAIESKGLRLRDRMAAFDILAELHFRNRRPQQSADYLKQITPDNRSPMRWFLLGTIEGPDSTIGRDALRKAVETAPDNVGYRRALIKALEQQGLNDEAERHRQIIELLSR